MAAGPRLLTARGLTVARGRRTLLQGIDLDLHAGEVVVVLGPNGVGKSTLVATLAGLVEPAAGSVDVHGRIAAALQAPALARRSVAANLDAALGWWGVPKHQRQSRAAAALDRLGVAELAPRRADTLSGGEARRVHLARALALQAEVLLLDEPFAGIDPPTRAALLRDASQVLRDPQRATMIVLHDRAEAWALADRVIVLLDGALAASGAPREILETPPTPSVAAFLGFTGRIATSGGLRLLRPSHVTLGGPVRGVVQLAVPQEDGVLCDVAVDGGVVQVRAGLPGPAAGDAITLAFSGGVTFPAHQVDQ